MGMRPDRQLMHAGSFINLSRTCKTRIAKQPEGSDCMAQSLDDQGGPQRWIFIFLIAGLILITTLFVLSGIFRYSGPELLNNPYSAQTRARPVSLVGLSMMVPENTLRDPEGIKSGEPVQKLDLLFLWPDMEGFSLENQLHFSDVGQKSRLVFVTLSRPEEPIATSARLSSIYSQHFTGEPLRGPANLIGFKMDKMSGLSGETIYFTPDQNRPYVIRCIAPLEESPGFCMRDLVLPQGLQLSYRIRKPLLNDWQKLDRAIIDKISSFLR